LEVLRQPLENKMVCISRAQQTLSFPASFLLVAAFNPCPCGYWGDKKRTCTCSAQSVTKYLEKLSGPLLDRIDLQIRIPSLDYEQALQKNSQKVTSSADLLHTVMKAVAVQQKRFTSAEMWNAYMTPDLIDKHCVLSQPAQELIKKAFDKLNISMRGYHKLLKVARTIADLEESEIIQHAHVQEAIMYRSIDPQKDTII
jgi:magnesium chelatase family protein